MKSQLTLFAIAVALLVAGCVWLASRSEERTPPNEPVSAAAELRSSRQEFLELLERPLAPSRTTPIPAFEPPQPIVVTVPARAAEPCDLAAGSVEVEIVDANGTPQSEVTVRLATFGASGGWSERSAAARARSDERGRVRLADDEPCRPRRIETPSVAPAVPMDSAASAASTPRLVEARPGERFAPLERLVVDPTGALEISLFDDQGRALDLPLEVSLAFSYENADTDLESDLWCEQTIASGGHASFPRVALGRRFAVQAVGCGQRGHLGKIQGPREAGERIRVALDTRASGARLHARLVDETGQPLRETSIQLLRASPSGEARLAWAASATTDADGAVEFALDAPRQEGACDWIALTGDVAAPARAVRFAAALRGDERADVDCGTLIVRSAPTLAAGRVIDPEGRAVAGANVMALGRRSGTPGLVASWPAAATTDALGRFRFNCFDTPEKLTLHADGPGFGRFANSLLRPGSDALEIRLARACIVRGRVLTPEKLPACGVSIVLCVDDSKHGPTFDVGADGWFESASVTPGRYRAEVRFGDELLLEPRSQGLPVLVTTEPFDLVAGDVRDLGVFDLGTILHAFSVRVFDPDGAKLADALVSPAPECLVSPIELRTGPSGTAHFLGLTTSIDARVSGNGYRAVELRGIGPRTDVALTPGIPVDVRLPAQLPAMSPPLELHVCLSEESFETHGGIVCFAGPMITQELRVSQRGTPRGGETWTLRVPRPGPYMVTAWLLDTRTNANHELRHPWQGPFAIGETGLGRPIELELDLDRMRELLAAKR